MNLNKVLLIGRITKTPELRTTPTGQNVTSFGLAINRTWTAKDGTKKQDVEFVNIVFWGRNAEIIVQYVVKGQLLMVEGRMSIREWEKNGEKHKTTEIVGERFQFGPKAVSSGSAKESIEPKAPEATTGQPATPPEGFPGELDEEPELKAEDLPF